MNSALYTYGAGIYNKYMYNTIINTTNALVIDDKFSLIEGNNIKNNTRGILIIEGFGNKIVRNNLISNSLHNAEIKTQNPIKALFGSDKWDYNYWDDLQGYFKFIPCYYSPGVYPFNEYYLPFTLNIDCHPAKKPYDIGG
jgi:parallel beta-helix repeat protein